jgi:outer membrane protein assembly factor BamB
MLRYWLMLLLTVASGNIAQSEDWPRWRGPRGDGTWQGPQLPEKWPEGGLTPNWKVPIGGGYSGVTVVGQRVFVMDRQLEPETERVLCFETDSGKLLWKHEYPVTYGKLDYGNGPRAAPTWHDGKLYTVGALGECRCLDATTGERIWSVSYLRDLGGKLPEWGYAGSVFIDGDHAIVQPGGPDGHSIAALHRHTGRVVWQSHSDKAGYATPLIVTHNGTRQLIVWTPSHIRGLDPATGQPFWNIPYEVTYGVAIAEPIFHEGLVLVCGYWHGSKAVRLGARPEDATLAWEENKFLRGLMSQPLYREGHVYLLDKQYGLTCFQLQTSKKLWDDDHQLTPRGRNPQASLVWLGDGDRVIALNSEGDLILARLNPTGYHEQSRANILGPTWAHPAYAGSRVYARNDTELVCVPLLPEDPKSKASP